MPLHAKEIKNIAVSTFAVCVVPYHTQTQFAAIKITKSRLERRRNIQHSNLWVNVVERAGAANSLRLKNAISISPNRFIDALLLLFSVFDSVYFLLTSFLWPIYQYRFHVIQSIDFTKCYLSIRLK